MSTWTATILMMAADWALKSVVILALAYAAVLLMRRAAAAARHDVLALAMASLLAIPCLSLMLPQLRVLPAWLPVVREPLAGGSLAPHLVAPAMDQNRSAIVLPPDLGLDSTVQPAAPINDRESLPTAQSAAPAAPVVHAAAQPPQSHSRLSIWDWVVLVWLAGVCLMFLPLVLGVLSLRRLSGRATVVTEEPWTDLLAELSGLLKVGQPVRLLRSGDRTMPMSWGIWRPKVLLPTEANAWTDSRRRLVLLHELAHVKRRDCMTQMIAHLACALYWFNPLAWVTLARLRTERERACDDQVLRAGSKPTDYADELLKIASGLRAPVLASYSAVAMARPSALEGRLLAILDPHKNRRSLTRLGLLLFAAAVLTVVVPVAMLRTKANAADAPAPAANVAPASDAIHATDARPAQTRKAPEAAIPRNLVSVRVVDPTGKMVPVEDIVGILVTWKEMGNWGLGPKPEIKRRLPDGSVLIDRQQVAPGFRDTVIRITMYFKTTNDVGVIAKCENPKKSSPLTLATESSVKEMMEFTSGLAHIAPDEIAGQVLDATGKPVAGVLVSFPENYSKAKNLSVMPNWIPPATTGSDGVFRFPGAGKKWIVYMQIDKEGFARRWLVDVPVGRGFVIRLDNTTHIKGDVFLPDGKPAAGATILYVTRRTSVRWALPLGFNPGDGPFIPKTAPDLQFTLTADDRGHFDALVEPVACELRASAPGGLFARLTDVQVKSGQSVEQPIHLDPGVHLRIRAVDITTGKPVSGATFYLEKMLGPFAAGLESGGQQKTNEQGIADWAGIMPGRQRFDVRAPGYASWGSPADPLGHQWVKPGALYLEINTINVDLAPGMGEVLVNMERGMHLTGRVVGPKGQLAQKVFVNVSGLGTGDFRYMRPVNDEGEFDLTIPVHGIFGHGQTGQYRLVVMQAPSQSASFSSADLKQVAASEEFIPKVGGEKSFTITVGGKTPAGKD